MKVAQSGTLSTIDILNGMKSSKFQAFCIHLKLLAAPFDISLAYKVVSLIQATGALF